MKIGRAPLADEGADSVGAQGVERVTIEFGAVGVERNEQGECQKEQGYAEQDGLSLLPGRIARRSLDCYSYRIGDEERRGERESAVQIEPQQEQRRNPKQKFGTIFASLDQPQQQTGEEKGKHLGAYAPGGGGSQSAEGGGGGGPVTFSAGGSTT